MLLLVIALILLVGAVGFYAVGQSSQPAILRAQAHLEQVQAEAFADKMEALIPLFVIVGLMVVACVWLWARRKPAPPERVIEKQILLLSPPQSRRELWQIAQATQTPELLLDGPEQYLISGEYDIEV